MSKVSVVFPALNEEQAVGESVSSVPFDELKKLGVEVEVLVVDNASDDKTAEKARGAGARVVFEGRRGYGSAYLRGFKEASGDIIVMLDADGTYPAEDIPRFIKPLLSGEADLVTGTRIKGKINPGALPWLHRNIGVPLLTWMLNLLYGTKVSDAHCGMRAFTKDALEKMELSSTGMEFASEMLIKAAQENLRVLEIPIEYRARTGGKPKLEPLRDGLRHMRFMLSYRFKN